MMKKGVPEKHLYKLRSGINWTKGKKGLGDLRHRKSQHKGPKYGGRIGETRKALCLMQHERERQEKHSVLHLDLMSVNYRVGNILGTGEQQYPANKGDEAIWVRRSQIMQGVFATLRNSVVFGKYWEAIKEL